MTTITFDENSEAGRTLMDVIHNMKPSLRKAIYLMDEPAEENIAFEKIPGLPYTHEERLESLRRAEADIAAGRTFTHEEVVERMKEKMQIWK